MLRGWRVQRRRACGSRLPPRRLPAHQLAPVLGSCARTRHTPAYGPTHSRPGGVDELCWNQREPVVRADLGRCAAMCHHWPTATGPAPRGCPTAAAGWAPFDRGQPPRSDWGWAVLGRVRSPAEGPPVFVRWMWSRCLLRAWAACVSIVHTFSPFAPTRVSVSERQVRAAERSHPTGCERIGSATLQKL